MASKRHERRKACDGKKRYESRDHALADAMNLQNKEHWHMRAYHCQFCGGWHVGHMPKKNIWAMKRARGEA